MRTLDAALTTAQAQRSLRYTAGVEIEGVDQSTYLVAYTYREAAMLARTTQVWLNNGSGIFTTSPPVRGDTVDLERGCFVGHTAYKAELPRLWVERVTYQPGYVILNCLDFWGKLARYRSLADDTAWTDTHPETIIDWLFNLTGLTRDGDTDDITIDYQFPRGQSGETMLKNVLAKVAQFPYAGLDAKVPCKILDPEQVSDYTFGWQSNHPVISASYSESAALYNKVTVYGALKEDDSRYSGSDANTDQSDLVGVREKFLIDSSLASDADCTSRAEAELTYYTALTDTAELVVRPCHGLELFDVITLANAPWGSTSLVARVSSFTEYFHPDATRQEIALSRASASDIPASPARLVSAGVPIAPALALSAPLASAYGTPTGDIAAGDVVSADIATAWLQAAYLPASAIAEATATILAPGSLSALQAIGAAIYDTSEDTHITTAAEAEAAFNTSANRAAVVGDILLDHDTTDSVYRIYVKVAAGTWATYTTAITLT